MQRALSGALTARIKVESFRAVDIEEVVRAGLIKPRLTARERLLSHEDRIQLRTQRVERDALLALGLDPRVQAEAEHNLETYTGLNNMLRLLIGTTVGAGGTNYANGTARLCVGDGNGSTPTAAVTDTALAAPTNRYNQACDSTYPSVPNAGNNSASAILTAVSTFATGNANFHWQEWGMDSGGSSGSGAASGLFNHRGVDLGTKTSAAAWALTATVTQS